MLATFFVVLSAVALLVLFLLIRRHLFGGQTVDNLASALRPIDIDAFRNLVDNREQEFLREHLPPREFRRVHRERMRAAVEYVCAAAQNAGRLVQLAQAAQESADPAISSAAENLLANAIQLRLYAFRTIPRLYVSMMFPGTMQASKRFAEDYDVVKRQMIVLACLQSPVAGNTSSV